MNKTVLVAITIAVLGGIVFFATNRNSTSSKKLGTGKLPNDFPPKPKWKPNIPVNIDKTIETFAYYTDKKKVFVIFKNGTCVLVPDGSEPTNAANEILKRVYNYHPDFNPRAMDDGNFLISYSQPAYSIVFKDEYEKNRGYIDENHLDGLTRDEVLLNAKGEANKFDDSGKIGLFARSRMFLDAQKPEIVKIWRPS
jgi:hypothetical protein